MTFLFATVSDVDMHFSDKLKKATTFGLSVFTGWYKIALLPNLQQNRKNALDTSPKHCHIKSKKKALIKSFIYKNKFFIFISTELKRVNAKTTIQALQGRCRVLRISFYL